MCNFFTKKDPFFVFVLAVLIFCSEKILVNILIIPNTPNNMFRKKLKNKICVNYFNY